MYTIGTSGIRWIYRNLENGPIKTALENKVVAYVGTQADRTGDPDDTPYPPALAGPLSVFFQVDAVAGNPHQISDISEANPALYIPNPTDPANRTWQLVGNISFELFNQVIKPAGGYATIAPAFPRGNLPDREYAIPHPPDGLPFYTKDTKELYVYDLNAATWILLAGQTIMPLGGIIHWPAAFGDPPTNWLRCDGTSLTDAQIAAYPQLAEKILDQFGTGYVLPTESNGIIKAK